MTDFTMFDYKVTDGVAVATFNRPDKMNTFTPVVMREMIFADTAHDRAAEGVRGGGGGGGVDSHRDDYVSGPSSAFDADVISS